MKDTIMINIKKLAPLLQEDERIMMYAYAINTSLEKFHRMVNAVQQSCPHVKCIETWENPRNPFDKGALLSKECTQCGLTQTKPKGMDWEICGECWAPMADDGDGRVGEDRAHFYKCTKCSHTTYHT